MEICKIEGATRVLGAPTEWNHAVAECQGLPIIDTAEGWMVSQWKPSADEVQTLARGGTLLLWVHGRAHPVVGIDVSAADGQVHQQDAPHGVVQELAHRNAEVKLLRLALQRLRGTLGDQQSLCAIALSATGEQNEANDL